MDKHRRGIAGLYLVVAFLSILGGVLEIKQPGFSAAPIVFFSQAVLFAVLGVLQFAKHS